MRIFISLLIICGLCLAQAPLDMVRGTKGSGYVLLGRLLTANFNTTADQPITMPGGKYVIRGIVVTNASASLTLAAGGFYAAASKTTAIVSNTQVFTALTGSSKYLDITLGTLLGTDVRTESTLYLSLTTGQGSAATADIYIFGSQLP